MLPKPTEFIKNQVPRSGAKVKMKAKAFIDQYQADIILVIGVILISLLSFAAGYITAKMQQKQPLIFEEETMINKSYESGYHRSWG